MLACIWTTKQQLFENKMNVKLFIRILFVIVITGVCSVSTSCVDLDSVTQDGKRMISSVFKMVDSVSLYTCVSHCLTVSTCMSVSYQRETRTCHLASQDSAGDPGDVHTDPEFFLTDISLWPRSLAGPCEGVTCATGSRCVVNRFNIPNCVTDEHLGCGPAPDLANADKSSTGQYEGAVTQYTCQSDFLFCGTISTHMCSSLGTWEGLSGACNRAVWYNPTLTFIASTPCPMTEGYKVTFEGNPTIHGRFYMTVHSANLTIQADVRLTFSSFHERFLLNKKSYGRWETNMDIPAPFAPGVKFITEIVRQKGRYEVNVNGTYYGHSEDLTPAEYPDIIRVDGDINLDRVAFLPV